MAKIKRGKDGDQLMDKEQLKEQQDKGKAEQKELEVTARRLKKRKEKSFLIWVSLLLSRRSWR